jgi:hypothetical protein
LSDAKTWTLWKVDQKYLGSLETWYCRRMDISWIDCVRHEKLSCRVKEERNILHIIRKRKAKWISEILQRNCLLKDIIEGKIGEGIEIRERPGKRHKQLSDDQTILEIERGSTRSHCLENLLWKRLQTCRTADYGVSE